MQKYSFFKVNFLDYIISTQDISLDCDKIKAINEYPKPYSIHDVRVS